MGKVSDNKLQKLNSLLSTSFELFTTKGFSQTSISDIVEKAQVAKGTFYLYFKDKYDLRDKLIINRAEKIFDHAIRYSCYQDKESFDDKLITVIDDILDQLEQMPLVTKFINKNVSWGLFNKTLNQGESYTGTNYLDMLKAEMDKEEVPYKNPELMLYMVIELVSATSYSVIIDKSPVDMDTFKPFLHEGIRSIMKNFK